MSLAPAEAWFKQQGWSVFPFQEEAWIKFQAGYNGIVNAPTGSGKTYSLLLPIMLEIHRRKEAFVVSGKKQAPPGLQAIWITPIRALGKEIQQSAQRAAAGLDIQIEAAIRTGDTSTKEKARLKRTPPDILITTPETLHLLLAQKDYPRYFRDVFAIVMDEWHELIGSKRGVQIELALSRMKTICAGLRIWGISATIGNMEESMEKI